MYNGPEQRADGGADGNTPVVYADGTVEPEIVSINPVEAMVIEKKTFEALQERLKFLETARTQLGAEFQDFRTAVRDRAIQAATEENWCSEGLNNALKDLGLDPTIRSYRVTVRVFAYQDVEMEIEANNEEEAIATALDDDHMNDAWSQEIPQGHWDSDGMLVDEPKYINIVEIS